MSTTIATYVGNGSQTNFAFSFDYLRREFVKVLVDGVEVAFTFHTPQTVQITPAPATGKVIIIRRETDRDRLVTFVDGSVLLAGDLNVAQLQAIHIAAEALDAASGSLLIDQTGAYSAGFRRIADLGDPTNPRDVVNRQWAETALTSQLALATAAQTAAETARTAAQTARDQAQASQTAAASSASTANTRATDAQTARTGAETARTGAETARTGAETARTQAQAAQTAAETARTGAETARTQAQAAQTAAETARNQAQSFAPTIATQAEAQAGTDNTRLMTPLRAREAAVASQGLELIGVYSLTGLSQLVVNNLSSFTDLNLEIVAHPTTATIVFARFSGNNGSTFDSAANYLHNRVVSNAGTASSVVALTSLAFTQVENVSPNTGTDVHASCLVNYFNKARRHPFRMSSGYVTGAGNWCAEFTAGMGLNTAAMNAIQIAVGAGTFASGELVIRGRRG